MTTTTNPELQDALEYLRRSADLYKRPDSLVLAKTREEALAAMEEWEQVLARLMVNFKNGAPDYKLTTYRCDCGVTLLIEGKVIGKEYQTNGRI